MGVGCGIILSNSYYRIHVHSYTTYKTERFVSTSRLLQNYNYVCDVFCRNKLLYDICVHRLSAPMFYFHNANFKLPSSREENEKPKKKRKVHQPKTRLIEVVRPSGPRIRRNTALDTSVCICPPSRPRVVVICDTICARSSDVPSATFELNGLG